MYVTVYAESFFIAEHKCAGNHRWRWAVGLSDLTLSGHIHYPRIKKGLIPALKKRRNERGRLWDRSDGSGEEWRVLLWLFLFMRQRQPPPPTCPLSPLYVHQGLKLYIRINSLTSSRLALPPVPVPLRLYMSTASLTALNAYISSGLASSSPTAVRHQRAVGLVIWSFYLNATLKILVLILLSHMSFNLKMLRLNETLFPPRNTVIPILL